MKFVGRDLSTSLSQIAAALAAACLCVMLLSAPAMAEQLSASGCSVSITGYLRELAEEYERRTGVQVYVRGGGSVLGIEEISKGKVDFAASCRTPLDSDPSGLRFIQVAWDVLVPIVHPNNPVTDLRHEQVREILLGRLQGWRALGGHEGSIKVFLSKSSKGLSGVESSINALILSGRPPAQGENVVPMASTALVEQMVESTPEGFAITGYTSARKRSVKMLSVDGVAPSLHTIIKGKYPYRRPLYLILPAKASDKAQAFVDFALSAEGQTYISSLGVVSLRDLRR